MNDIIERLETLEHYEIADDLEELKKYMILNVNNFERELERQGLMTEKLRDFIENYMKFDNN